MGGSAVKTNVALPDESGGKESKPAAPDAGAKPKRSVRVDFTKASKPFKRASSADKRLKAFLWGDSGVGKTTMSLQFPSPVVIDLEGGTDLYGGAFEFDVLRATDADEVNAAVDWLAANEHAYRTLIIDPITIFWDALQKKWSDIFLRRNKGSKGFKFEFYDLQPRDWMTIKAEFKEFVRKLIALDMNVIVTAREKTKYRDGGFMQAIGETFDGEKSLPYLFDVVLRLFVDEKGRHMAKALKDRSNKLPKQDFEINYGVFEGLFGKETLTREAKPTLRQEVVADAPPQAQPAAEHATDEQIKSIQGLLRQLGLTHTQVKKRLAAYGAQTLDDLSAESAKVIIEKLEAAAAAKR